MTLRISKLKYQLLMLAKMILMSKLFQFQLREFCMRLHKLVKQGNSDDEINTEKESMMEEVSLY